MPNKRWEVCTICHLHPNLGLGFLSNKDDELAYSSDYSETDPLLHYPNTLWQNFKEASNDLYSLLTIFTKFLGISSNKKKSERSEDMSHYHMRHYRHRQLPNRHVAQHPSPAINVFSVPNVRTRRSATLPSTWQAISSNHQLQPNDLQSLRLSTPTRVLLPTVPPTRRSKRSKYTTFQALYMTLYVGELRVDLIDLITTVSSIPCTPFIYYTDN